MTALRYFFKRLRALWRPDDIHDEISEEMRFHIELRAEENLRRGMTPEEARREAERQFGRFDRIKDEGYGVRVGRGRDGQRIAVEREVLRTDRPAQQPGGGWRSCATSS